MKAPSACSGAAFGAVTVATTLVLLLLAAAPASATGTAPAKDGGEIVVNVHSAKRQHFPVAVKRPDGKYIVSWSGDEQDGNNYGVFMQLFHADGSKMGTTVQVNTYIGFAQIYGRVAVASDNSFVFIWQSFKQDGAANTGVYSQRFDSNGAPVGSEFPVSPQAEATQDMGDVAYLTNGDVVYCWRDKSSGLFRIRMRRYSSTFVPIGGEVIVDTRDTQAQHYPRVEALAGGGFVIAYVAWSGCWGQLFAANGDKVGTPFRLNTDNAGSQYYPEVAALPNGGFVAVWEDTSSKDGSGSGCYAQEFSSTAVPVGAAIVVNTYTLSHQYRPRVAAFGDNSFVVTYFGQISSGSDAFDIGLQRFDAAHNKVGPTLIVNTRTADTQEYPTVAANFVDGKFVVAWASNNHIGVDTELDVVMQLFDGNAAPIATECTSACLRYFCTEGSLIDIKVTGVVSNDVWGATFFTDDSNVAAAAVFAGLVTAGQTATVTVKCSGPKPSFASASANGVTTQAFASSWPSSFTFDLGGETQAPPAPAPERCTNDPCAVGKCNVQGTTFDLIVAGTVSSNVWGTNVFSDDSWVGTAAVHQGLIQAGSTGSVTLTCVGPQGSLSGSTRNGVTSNDFGPWQFTFTLSPGPTAAPTPEGACPGACLEGKCPENNEIFVRVAGSTYGHLWGSSPYSDDTTVAAAAVHAGLVSAGAVAIVKATCTGAQSSFTGSTQNAVTTSSYGPWSASFTLSAGTGMPTMTCGAGSACLISLCKVTGHVFKVSVTGSTAPAQFWGTTIYSDDSPLSHAAVHAGLLQNGETAVLYATCAGAQDSFTGSTAFGLTSLTYAQPWPASFTLSTTP